MLTTEQLDTLRMSKPVGRNRLKTAIDLAGLKQTQFARRVGLSSPKVSALVKGYYGDRLSLETSRRIARFFGAAVEDIFPSVRVKVEVLS